MIQRIQSIWLLLASAASFITFKYSVFSGNKLAVDNTKKFVELNGTTTIFLLLLAALLGTGAFIAIFLYKNRKLQLRITITCIVLSIINIILYFTESNKFVQGEGNYNLTAIIALSIPVLLILAARGIHQDEKLIRDSSRLR